MSFDARKLAAAAVVVLAAVVVITGLAVPPVTRQVGTDAVGPEAGIPVEEYVAQARKTLIGDGDRWALVSFTKFLLPARISGAVNNVRVADVIVSIPLDRVTTPVRILPMPASVEALDGTAVRAVQTLATHGYEQPRDTAVADVVMSRIAAGFPCVAGVVVRASMPQLAALSDAPGVRAVEALPADAVGGSFAIHPLLPTMTTVVGPGPDDGPVPPA